MDTHIVFHLFLFLFFVSEASSQSAITTTYKYNTTTLLVPVDETFIVAMKPTCLTCYVNYTIATNQEVIYKDVKYGIWSHGSQWLPHLIISKESVWRPYDKKDFSIPVNDSRLSEWNLTVSSWEKVFWQTFSLPLTHNAMDVINEREEKYIDLPDGGDVFVAVWNAHGREIRIDLRLQNGEKVTLQTKQTTARKGWSIISVIAYYLVYDEEYSTTDNTGRRLWMFVHEQIRYQVFTMPLKPRDKSATLIIIIIGVLLTSVVLVGALYSGYRVFLRKRNQARHSSNQHEQS